MFHLLLVYGDLIWEFYFLTQMFPLLHISTLLWTGKSRWEGVALCPAYVQNLVSLVCPLLTVLKSPDLLYMLLGLPSPSCLLLLLPKAEPTKQNPSNPYKTIHTVT